MAGLTPVNIHNVPVPGIAALTMPQPDDLAAPLVAQQQNRLSTAMAAVRPDLEVHHLLPQAFKAVWDSIGVDCNAYCVVLLASHHAAFKNQILIGTVVSPILAAENYQDLWGSYVNSLKASTAYAELANLSALKPPNAAQAAQITAIKQALTTQVVTVVLPMLLRRVGLDPAAMAHYRVNYSIVSDPDNKLAYWYHPTAWKPTAWNAVW